MRFLCGRGVVCWFVGFFFLRGWMIAVDLTSPTTITALSLTMLVVNLWIRSWRVCLILALIALTLALFPARIATQLKNCVSSYMDRHNNNELEIIVIVKPDGSYLSCIEVSPSESKNLLNTRDSQMAGGINHDYENQVKQARLIYNKPLKKLFEAPEPVITFPELINYFVQNKIDYHCHDLYN